MVSEEHKTGRIALLCATLVILGLMLAMFKSGGCACDPPSCEDEFFELNEHRTVATCEPGAHAEVVSPPLVPKPGVLCHCTKNDKGTVATSAT